MYPLYAFFRTSCSKLLFQIVLSVSISLAFTVAATAGEYYVSPSGSAAWSECVISDVTCSAVTGMNNAIAGDTVYFRGGTYPLTGDSSNSTYTGTSTYQGRLQPANSGVSGIPITFRAYPGETPVLDVDWYEAARLGRALGTNGRDYIIFDGFTVISEGGKRPGSIVISDHDGEGSSVFCTVRNCNISGGSLGPNIDNAYWGDNVEGIRIERANNIIIENNYIHSFREHSENGHNTSGTKSYSTSYVTYINNEFYNNTNGLYIKGNANLDILVENNYFHDNYIALTYATKSGNSNDLTIFNNVFYKMQLAAISDDPDTAYVANNLSIYNNSFINANLGSVPTVIVTYADLGDKAIVYNNIFYNENSVVTLSSRAGVLFKEYNHNAYYPSIKIEVSRYLKARYYTSLSAWQSSNELEDGSRPGTASLSSDPLFVNISGQLNQLSDFALSENSPYKGAGRDGADIGADTALVGRKLTNPKDFSGKTSPPPP